MVIWWSHTLKHSSCIRGESTDLQLGWKSTPLLLKQLDWTPMSWDLPPPNEYFLAGCFPGSLQKSPKINQQSRIALFSKWFPRQCSFDIKFSTSLVATSRERSSSVNKLVSRGKKRLTNEVGVLHQWNWLSLGSLIVVFFCHLSINTLSPNGGGLYFEIQGQGPINNSPVE